MKNEQLANEKMREEKITNEVMRHEKIANESMSDELGNEKVADKAMRNRQVLNGQMMSSQISGRQGVDKQATGHDSVSNRFEQGWEQLAKVDGKGGEGVINALEGIAPDLGRYIIEFAFGDIYTRKGLSLQERELITLASLLTMGGCEPQLRVHINGALNVGISRERIVEAFMQCIPYVGFPRVLNAVFVAKDIFTAKEVFAPQDASTEKGDFAVCGTD